jgi:hypothetical protein
MSFYINAVDGFAVILRYRGEPLQKTAPVLKNLKKIIFFCVFSREIKANRIPNRIKYCGGKVFPKNIEELSMRANRVLLAKGWYWVSTDVNNREAVFRLSREVRRLKTVLHEARKIYEFEVRGLRVEDDRVSFYINAVDEVAAILLNRGQLPQKPLQF